MSIPARFKEYERFTLEGPNLGSRQKELNMRVLDAASEVSGLNMNLADETLTDVDILFRIELAFKYRCIDFLMEVMKTGDSLYISRALKCDWMYDEEFLYIINVEYLKFNVFPSMSMKMRKKFLSTAAMHITEPKRASEFYKYCMEVKLINIALKYLISTSVSFKLQLLNNSPDQIYYVAYKDDDIKYFIANSFTVADSYLKLQKTELGKAKILCQLSYLYKISNSEYLELLEKNCKPYSEDKSLIGKFTKLGRRISKHILTNYKQRVLQTPILYVIMLSKISMAKQSTVDDVKAYLKALLYDDVNDFWKSCFCSSYDYLINKIPEKERFQYMKKIFNEKYTEQEFELDKRFNDLQWYKFMTVEEIEQWALAQIAYKKDILGPGKDYNWYKFVNFEIAFEEIKKLVEVATVETDRAQIVYALINSAKTQRHLEKLFNYYCATFSKEETHVKGNFIDRVASYHNVYEFDEECWAAFYKVLQTLDLHNLPEMNKNHFVTILIVYNIISDIDLDENLTLFVHTGIYFFTVKMQTDQLSPERTEKVFNYLLNAYMDKVYELDSKPYGEDVKYQIRKYVYYVLDLCKLYEKPAKDIPDVIIKLMNKDIHEFQGMRVYEYDLKKPKKVLNELDLLRFLKKDIALSKEFLPLVKKRIEIDYRFNIGVFLKKIKVYFPNDLTLEYIKLYRDLLSANVLYPKVALAAAYGIFHLADYKDRISFVTVHAPLKSKDYYQQEDVKVLCIQEAICATAYYSRPPLPLDIVLMYVKGDYVARCLPMLNSYLVNLPIDDCIEFVARILNTTLVQKYGVRLAFGCFNLDNLQKLIWSIWKKTKDVSLRMVLYKALYAKIVKDDLYAPTALFETLCKLTQDMNINDDKEAFSIMTAGGLPRHLAGEYTIVAWKAVNALPDISIGIQRKSLFVRFLYRYVNSLSEATIRTIIDEIITSEFHTEKPPKTSPEARDLDKAKWEFIAKYILSIKDEEHLELKWEMVESILDRCLNKFNLIHDDTYMTRMLCYKLIRTLMSESYFIDSISIDYGNILFDNILQKLKSSFKIEDVHMLTWEIRIDLLVRKTIGEVLIKVHTLADEDEQSVVFRDILISFGKDIAKLIIEYIEGGLYFRSFLPELYNVMNDKMNNLANFANRDVGSDDVAVMVCWALIEYKIADLDLFTAVILPPDNCRSFTEDYKFVLKQLKDLNDTEINCKLREKFVNSDFKVKPLYEM